MTTLFNWSSSSEPQRPKRRQNIITALTTLPQGWVSACKNQCMTAITTTWTRSSWAFPESYTADESWIVRSSDGGQRGDKRAHNSTTCTLVSLRDSDHEGVVRIFVALSCELWGYLLTSGNHTPGSRFYSDLLDTSVCIHQLVLKHLSKR